MKLGKKSGIIISFILAVIVFFGLIVYSRTLIAPEGTTDIYIAKNKIEKGTVVKEDNILTLFEKVEDVNNKAVIEGAFHSENELTDLIDRVASENIQKGEMISANRFIDKESIFANNDNIVEVSISSSDISEIVGGILREGDFINISMVDPVTKDSTRILENVYIDKAFSTDGTKIDRDDTMAAARINVLLTSAEDEAKLNKSISLQGIKVSKVR